MTSPKALCDKKVLVTGGVGFLGSYLCELLLSEGARVVVLDKEEPHDGTLFAHKGLADKCETVTANVAELRSREFVEALRPEYIFNLAGVAYAPYTTKHQDETFRTNVVGVQNLVQACHRSDTVFVQASSACVFGATQASPLGRNDKRRPGEHYYTESKQRAESLVTDAGRFLSSATICRFGNIYGPGDRITGRIIPSLSRQLVADETATAPLQLRRSDGTSVFEYLHVRDAARALVLSAKKSQRSVSTWHFTGGPASRRSVSDLARKLIEAYDGRARVIEAAPAARSEKRVIKYLDDSYTRLELRFAPQIDFETGLSETVHWYRSHPGTLKPSLFDA